MILKTVVTNFVLMKMMFISIIASLALSTCGSGRSQAAAIASVDSFVEIDAADLADEPKAVVEWDKTVHDFGDVSVSDGPLTCSFTLTNKGSGIQALSKELGVSLSDIAAFGDQFNDESMLSLAGRPYIMAHAPKALLEKGFERCEKVMPVLVEILNSL